MANVAGAMMFGQFLADRPFSLMLAVAGAAGWLVVAGWTLSAARNDGVRYRKTRDYAELGLTPWTILSHRRSSQAQPDRTDSRLP